MSDYIDREAALNCFHDWVDRRGDVHTPDEMAEYRALEALPSVQPEIIRCEECKFYDHFWNGDWCSLKNIDVKDANDFCSGAERRTDE